jgi:hypothetical protein
MTILVDGSEHDISCFNHGDCDGVRELLRKIRTEIGEIEVTSNDGWDARARALTVLFNLEAKVR